MRKLDQKISFAFKTYLHHMMVLALAAFSMTMVACNSNSGNPSSPAAALANCPTGNVYSSQFGCIPQSTCAPGYGYYAGACVLVNSSPTSTTSLACQVSCPTGYVSTASGCLAQGPCPVCFGHQSPYCVSGSSASSGTYYLGY